MEAARREARSKYYHPYEPYDIQYDLMKVIYECIDTGKIGILESPTGTGKSLSLICASLTWLRDFQKEALKTSGEVDESSNEPRWVLEHEAAQKRQAILERRSAMEANLRSIRAKENNQRKRYENPEPAPKRSKLAQTDRDPVGQNEVDFELEDYLSEDDNRPAERRHEPSGNALSSRSQELMQKLGLITQQEPEAEESPIDEVKILFCSRTHSQLNQFTNELRRVRLPSSIDTESSNGTHDQILGTEAEIKHLVLSSRKNLCINPQVSRLGSGQAITERCLDLQQPSTPKAKKCSFLPHKETETLVHQFRDSALARVRDIEDLGTIGRKIGICPYYASRATIKPSEIVTLPYPLLLQKSAREALDLSLKDHVVIIDEAHNLMDTIAQIHSISIDLGQLKLSRGQLDTYLQKFRHKLKGKNRVYVAQLLRLIDSMTVYLNTKRNEKTDAEGVIDIADLLAGKGVDQINMHKLVTYLQQSKLARKVEGYVAQEERQRMLRDSKTASREQSSTLPVLTQIQSFAQTLANPAVEGRFFFEKDTNGDISIKYMLLDPTFHFKDIVDEARAVILAGGTMSPMDEYRNHLFRYLEPKRIRTFSCGHIIPKENLLVRSVIKGPGKVDLDFTFEKRKSPATVDSLGKVVVQLSKCIPDGLVVFFPSYGYLDYVVEVWKKGQIWKLIEEHKAIFQETKGTNSIDNILGSYADTIAAKKGACMLSVIGGKLSEGINFSDALGRGIVVIGLPFPNVHTAQWKAKLEFIEKGAATNSGDVASGKSASSSFVENVCMRAVNQSIGRAIRHKTDYASIVLLDRRYSNTRIQRKLPAWILQEMPSSEVTDLDGLSKDLEDFFRGKEQV